MGGGCLTAVICQLDIHKTPNLVQSYAIILVLAIKMVIFCTFLPKYLVILRANALHLSNISTFGRRLVM